MTKLNSRSASILMKFKVGLTFVSLLIMIASCKKDNQINNDLASISISPLKTWYEKYQKSNDNNGFLSNVKPEWESIVQIEKEGKRIFELNCSNNDKIIFGKENTTDGEKNLVLEKTQVKLLLFIGTDDAISGAYMVSQAENATTKETHYQSFQNFDGKVSYYTLSSEFTNGYIYKKGIISATSKRSTLSEQIIADKPNKEVSAKGKLMLADVGGNCSVIVTPVYGQQCIMVLPIEGMQGGGVTNCVWVVVDTYASVICPGADGGGGGGYQPPINDGGGGGGGGSTPPASSMVIAFNGTKVDPKKETKCFNKTQPATMTIYVQQPNPNTRDMNGQNSVGHAFIGITQNGITRSMGFYPNSPTAAVFGSQTSEIHDNSGEMYHVSISKGISAAQLSQVIDYINNYPSTYSLSTYNCTDFAIGVAQQGGLSLPATTGTTSQFGFTFSGRNPGDLGQDLRSASLPPGVTKTTNQTNAPAKSGNCP